MTTQKLTEQESKIIKALKEPGFGAYLQYVFLSYPEIIQKIEREEYPKKASMEYLNNQMRLNQIAFDEQYFFILPQNLINPLKKEQEAWRLLSPLIENQFQLLETYLESYNPSTASKNIILGNMQNSWNLHQDWNIISSSYRAKLCKNWDEIKEKEQKIEKLIKKLS